MSIDSRFNHLFFFLNPLQKKKTTSTYNIFI